MTTNYAYCINTQCKMADSCSHALKYHHDENHDSQEVINVINPSVISFDEEGKCQFYIEPKLITVAHGMLKSTGAMPHKTYIEFSHFMQKRWNRTDYFDRRSGKKPMMPKHQDDVIATAKELGYTFPDSPWDETTEEIQYYY